MFLILIPIFKKRPRASSEVSDPVRMKNCIFCSIIEGEIPASVVLDSADIVAFLDASPINTGYTIVVPRRHVAAFTQLNPAETGSLATAVQRIATSLKERLPGCVGITLSLADGEDAGQEVPHVHFHVIPRYAADGFGWRRFGQPAGRVELDAVAAQLRIAGRPMPGIPKLETERLCLRPFALGDALEVQRLAGERIIADTTLNIPHPYRDGMAEAWISAHPAIFAEGRGVTFAITRQPAGALVGAISLMGMAKGHQAELGYWVASHCWNQGICTEAGMAVLRYAFLESGLIRVHSRHLTRNLASGRVMRKLGMRHEGSRRSHVRKWDKPEDEEVYGF